MSFYVPLNKDELADKDTDRIEHNIDDITDSQELLAKYDSDTLANGSPYVYTFAIVLALLVLVNLCCLGLLSRETSLLRSSLHIRLDFTDTRSLPFQ